MPSGSESSESQATNQNQVGVQGGSGGTAIGVGANAAGTVGNAGITTTGSANTISVTETDEGAVQGALGLGELAVSDSSTNANNALSALENIEADSSVVQAVSLQGNANVATGAEQAIAGQQVSPAFSTGGALSNVSPEVLIGGVGLLLALVFYISHRK